jgi:hypothetical protein
MYALPTAERYLAKKNLRTTSVFSVSLCYKKYLNRFGEFSFSRLTSIRPKHGNGVIFLFYKDVAPRELLLIGIKR